MKKTIILFVMVLIGMGVVSCSPDSILEDSTFDVQGNGDNGGGTGTGSTTIKPPPPPPITEP